MIHFFLNMKTWFFWAGLSFIVGGLISLALSLGVQLSIGMLENLTGYAMGWIAVGIVLIVFNYVKQKKKKEL